MPETASEKVRCGDVARCLVGAELALRLGREIPVHRANKGDRKSRLDRAARLGDFEIESAVIEIAVGLPDDKHVAQVADVLDSTQLEVWLLTRADRVATWRNELEFEEAAQTRRVVVASVEAFVGQNITEMGEFSAQKKAEQLRALFELYNAQWVAKVGTPGIRIVAKGK